jgi:chemotaxis protein CheC
MTELRNLNEFHLDVLREIGNIGAGHAATALSTLLQQEIQMKVPRVRIASFDEIADIIGGAEQIVIGVFLRTVGEIPGNIFFLLSLDSAKRLLDSILGGNEHSDSFSDMEISAISEVGNILASSYISSMSDFIRKEIQVTVPAVSIDMAGAILSVGLIPMGEIGDLALVVETELLYGNREIEGYLFLLPDPGTIETIFQALGVEYS